LDTKTQTLANIGRHGRERGIINIPNSTKPETFAIKQDRMG